MKRALFLCAALCALRWCSPASRARGRSADLPQPPATGATAQLHDAWDALLRAHVHDGRVDYVALATRDMGKLDRYLIALAQVHADSLPGPDRMAYWINLYNATVVRGVCARWRPGWRPDADQFGLFKAPIVRTPDGAMPLDALEHTVMLRQVPDPRLHAGLCCASVSCPPLRAGAYRGVDVDSLLDQAMRSFVNDPARNRFDEAKRTMTISRVFDWYAKDFGGPEAVPQFLEFYYGKPLAGWKVQFADYDWALNEVTPAAAAPGATPPAPASPAKKKK
ncbi:MAG: DUF547 domain-containing protein [Candidatus Eisenbacteria bacterium]|nr:DUF547 domain-containing protein [Candidatus Eisenbacteria bacterium]